MCIFCIYILIMLRLIPYFWCLDALHWHEKNMSLFVFLFSILLSVATTVRLSRFYGLLHLLISTMLTSVLFPEQSEPMDYIGRHVHLDCLNASPPPCY